MMRGNMKILKYAILIVFITIVKMSAQNPDIEVIYHETFLYDTASVQTDIIFYFEVINISNEDQIVFVVRTINDLPFPEPQWSSSLCFGELCFPSDTDSIATSGGPNPPLASGDTLFASLHVYPQSGIGTAYIQVQLGTFAHPNDRITLNFIATTDPSVGIEDEIAASNYFLAQNYPNPFNPSTQIYYGVKEGGIVSLKVFNILGSEIGTLVNEFKSAGNYIIDFKGGNLASGIYIYRMSVNNFIQTRKMILEK